MKTKKTPKRIKIAIDAAADDFVREAARDLDDDRHSLHDFYMYCKRYRPAYFRNMSIDQFRRWNDKRLQEIDYTDQAEADRADQIDGLDMLANRILLKLLIHASGVDDDVMNRLVMLKNALVEEVRGKEDEIVAPHLQTQLAAYLKNQPARLELSELAQAELDRIQVNCHVHDARDRD